MTPAEFTLALDADHHRRAERIHCLDLADALVREGHIEPWARQLVAILGKQGDRTNLEALTTWVTREVAKSDSTSKDIFDRLYLRLAGILVSEGFGDMVETDPAIGFPIKRKRDHLSGTATDFMGDSATC